MDIGAEGDLLRTRRLELLPLSAPVMDAVIAGRADEAALALGASLSRWLMDDPTHLVQLRRAGEAAESAGFVGSARVVVLSGARRRAIGTIGFHGAPDDAGRLEVACTIHPAHRGRGYGAEATAALLDWATERFGITRFLLALPSHRRATDLVPIEMGSQRTDRSTQAIDALADLLEGAAPAE
jgi:RimJ/RimL family protein N-acetyltransferase